MGSLIRQLALKDSAYIELIKSFQDQPGSYANQLNYLQHFYAIASKYSTVMIVLDGLDECALPNERKLLLDFLSSIESSDQFRTKIIMTSRDELDIRNRVGMFPNIAIAARSTDVKLYVASEVESRSKSNTKGYGMRLCDPSLKEEILNVLVQKGNGM